jgi:hypothetical protein
VTPSGPWASFASEIRVGQFGHHSTLKPQGVAYTLSAEAVGVGDGNRTFLHVPLIRTDFSLRRHLNIGHAQRQAWTSPSVQLDHTTDVPSSSYATLHRLADVRNQFATSPSPLPYNTRDQLSPSLDREPHYI